MLKFSRYFFVMFLISAVLPLILMFSWSRYIESHLQKKQEHRIFEFGVKQLNFTIKNYLETRKNNILRIINNIPAEKITPELLENTLAADKVISVNDDKHQNQNITAYYDLVKIPENKPELIAVFDLPFKDNKFEIIYKVDVNELYPSGPFEMELYSGENIAPHHLLEVILDPFAPPPPPHHRKPIFHPHRLNSEVIKLTDSRNNTVASILLKWREHNPRPGIPPEKLSLIILFIGALFSIFIGLHLNNNLIKPLLILSNALDNLRKGDLFCKLNINVRQKELQKAFQSFNEVVNSLQEKEEIRNSFISNLTHDLRTPLIAQEKALELLSEEFKLMGKNDSFKLAKSLEKNNSHLLRMVNLILEAYRFDQKALKLVLNPINLYELIENCFEQLQILSQEKNISLTNKIQRDFPSITADKGCLNRIFLNLLSNSIENVPNEGNIIISAKHSENTAEIIIEDNGNGILPEDLEHIFDRYFTGKNYERKIGSGLGLYVCKELIKLHHGEIYVESERGKYTRFIINLPINPEENKE